MKKKIFAVSDIHGYFSEMKYALDEAGFCPNCEDHLLIVCGDCFDRGRENFSVYQYLLSVRNKILIKGNHEDILSRILRTKRIQSEDYYNGLSYTLCDFFGNDVIGDDGYLDFSGKEDAFQALMSFMENMYDYYETEHYIFTHAWLPAEWRSDKKWVLSNDFRHEKLHRWTRARFSEWYQMYEMDLTLEDKTIVCGHRSSKFGRLFDASRDPFASEIFFGKGVVAIDALTMQSGRVNVFVTEDEISYTTHEMTLCAEPFFMIRNGEKNIELRLFDEKRRRFCVGDRIVFKNAETPSEKVCAEILGLYVYENFEMLSLDFAWEKMGIPGEIDSPDEYMNAYYSKEEIFENGVIAIKILLLSGDRFETGKIE